MIAYRKYVTVTDPKQIVLSGIPFQVGERVEVLVIAERDRVVRCDGLRALLRTTQSLPQAREITEEEIAAEIAAYRAAQ